ncbi:MAG: phosphate-selective porin O and P superfamily protein [uncultured bacterium]|nr:MAG: phosphate-selective porin O and P superfamily protein [uncultured bacterium]
MRFAIYVFMFLILGFSAFKANAETKIDINEDINITVGMVLQSFAIVSEKDLNNDKLYESYDEYIVRRGALLLSANINEVLGGFVQTQVSSLEDDDGYESDIVDAYLNFMFAKELSLMTGVHMVPANRQNITSSSDLMALERPGNSYKTLSWGTRSVNKFATSNFLCSDTKIRGDYNERDVGLTLYGDLDFSEDVHVKYYTGVYNGIQYGSSDNPRYCTRVQLNLLDGEDGYLLSSTYLGNKQTIGFGISYDTQSDIAVSVDKGTVDYKFKTFDVFADLAIGTGMMTFEFAYMNLDLGNSWMFYPEENNMGLVWSTLRSEGKGFYCQTGYLINKWQPWLEYESWNSDSPDGRGGYNSTRVGVSYFLKGHNMNIKGGYEIFKSDTLIAADLEDSIRTFMMGFFVKI